MSGLEGEGEFDARAKQSRFAGKARERNIIQNPRDALVNS